MTKMDDYFGGVQRGRISPKDPFSHAAWLLTPDDNKLPSDDVVDKQVQLSYIGEDRMLRLYQNDAMILTQIKNMATREDCLVPVYLVLEGAWRSELKLSRTLKGMERQLQGTTGGAFVPREGFGEGYGTQFAEDQRKAEENQMDAGTLAGFIKKIGKKKK